jgi:hypothetical protein
MEDRAYVLRKSPPPGPPEAQLLNPCQSNECANRLFLTKSCILGP